MKNGMSRIFFVGMNMISVSNLYLPGDHRFVHINYFDNLFLKDYKFTMILKFL